MLPIYLHALYCDDIRHEIGGKTSFIGGYSSVLYVKSFPITMPQLAVALWLCIPIETTVQSIMLAVSFETDDNILASFELGPDEWADAIPKESSGSSGWVSLSPQVVMSPMTLEGPGRLRVRALINGTELVRGPALRVERRPEPQISN